MSRRNQSEASLLEKFRVSLENVEKQPQLNAAMAEVSYTKEKIEEGRALLQNAMKVYLSNKKEDEERNISFDKFHAIAERIHDTYTSHRKKAKVVFMEEPLTLNRLKIDSAIPSSYVKKTEAIKHFYTELAMDTGLTEQLSIFKITPDLITDTLHDVENMEQARAIYLKEKGESQDATKMKDAALGELETWMRRFYAIAKIAMEDRPQLLESLGYFVRS